MKEEKYIAKLIIKDFPSMTPKEMSRLVSWLHDKQFEIMLMIDGYESEDEYAKNYTSEKWEKEFNDKFASLVLYHVEPDNTGGMIINNMKDFIRELKRISTYEAYVDGYKRGLKDSESDYII